MTKSELIDRVAEQCEGVAKADVAKVYDATWEGILKALGVDKKFTVSGFGTFTLRDVKARTGRNPKTGEPVQIAASRKIAFKMAAGMKEKL